MISAGRGTKGFTIAELLIVAAIFFVMIALLTPFVNMTKGRSRRLACTNNLREISLGLHRYAADHNDAFPKALGELYPRYVAREQVFDCPSTKNVGTKEKPDYAYVTGLTEASAPREIIVSDLPGNHRRATGNVLRVDGSIEWIGRR